jgi:hypothetical protein
MTSNNYKVLQTIKEAHVDGIWVRNQCILIMQALIWSKNKIISGSVDETIKVGTYLPFSLYSLSSRSGQSHSQSDQMNSLFLPN